jgi:hypothetical protein
LHPILKQNAPAGLKDKTEIKTPSNFKAAAAGVLISYAGNLFFAPIFKYLLLAIFSSPKNELIFKYLYFANEFTISADISDEQFVLIHLFVLIAVIAIIEFGNILFLRTGAGYMRFLLVAYQTFNIGYLLFWIVKGAISLFVDPTGSNDLVQISILYEMNENGRLFLAFAMLMFTLVYSNVCLTRLKKYIVLPQKF